MSQIAENLTRVIDNLNARNIPLEISHNDLRDLARTVAALADHLDAIRYETALGLTAIREELK